MSTKPLNLESETTTSTNIGEEIRIELEKRGLRAPSTHKLVDEIKRMKAEIGTSNESGAEADHSEMEDANLITHPAITADGKGQLLKLRAPTPVPENMQDANPITHPVITADGKGQLLKLEAPTLVPEDMQDANPITDPAITADGKDQLLKLEAPTRFPEEIVTGMLVENEQRLDAIEQELSVQVDDYQPDTTGNLLADASHELRVPLQAITGFLELLNSDKVSNAQEAKHFLNIAYSESQYLTNRVADLEVAALIEAGIFRVRTDPVLVNQLIKSCVQSHAMQAGNKQILLKEEHLEDLPTIFGDESHIRHALSNLIEWAVGSSLQKSEIIIRAGVENDSLWIGVESRPLPPGDESEPISQIHQGSFEENTNKGMSIFIAKHIIETHGGELIMRETSDDEQYCRIILPLSMEKNSKGTILITEDDPHTGLLLEFALEQEGYSPIRATNGSDALRILEETELDLIILDAILPGMDGFELCQRIRSIPRLDTIPVVMASAKAQEENRAKAISLGANEYFQKPLSLSTLIPAVQQLIEDSHRTVKSGSVKDSETSP